jgi:hypothetical protein
MKAFHLNDKVKGAMLAMCCCGLAFFLWDGISHDHRNSYEGAISCDLKQIYVACNMYSEDNEGVWPVSLDELNSYGINEDLSHFRLPGRDNKWKFDWVYIHPSNFGIKKNRNRLIVLATPTSWMSDRKPPKEKEESYRIVAYYDGEIEKVTEVKYRNKIAHNN